jgi:2-dehydropantoate 2-reductase
MKVCVYGAGAVGGFIGAQLSRAGEQVSAIDRGAALEALRQHGFRVESEGDSFVSPVTACEDPTALGTQDVVFVAVKGPVLPRVARGIGPLIGPHTVVVTAMNGVPWWFFEGFGGQYSGTRLHSVDPGGLLAAGIPADRVVGCVVHGSFQSPQPGIVHHVAGRRLIIGEPGGGESERVRSLEVMLGGAGFEVEVAEQIQLQIWYKLWGNMTMNPISALTGATSDRILDDPQVNQFCLRIMAEAARIGEKIGCRITETGEQRNKVTRQLGAFKTSMLQDVESGRPVELDSLVTVVREIGELVGEPTPHVDILLGLTRLHARVHGLYPDS